MKKGLAAFVVLLLLLAFAPFGRAQFGSFGDVPIEINAEQTRFEGGIAIAEGNVVIQYGATTIYCDYGEYNPDTRDVLVRGSVRIYREGRLFVGDRAIYNLETKELRAANFRGESYPLKFFTENLSSLGGNAFQARGSLFTTSDSSKPDYSIRAKSVRIYPKNRVVFSNVTLYIGNTPVFWFPYLYQSLERDTSFSLTPGYRSEWGAFLLSTWNFPIAENWQGRLHFDLRSQRGVAVGLDSDFTYGKDERSWGRFRSYYANDSAPPTIKIGDVKVPVDPNRYRVSFQHRLYISDDIYASIDINKLSDSRFLQDFLPNEFRVDPQPDNVASVTKWDQNYTASLIYRRQLNTFFDATERLPEFVMDFKRQPLFGTAVFYEGETGVARLNRNFAKGSGLPDYGVTRVDSFHEIMVPQVYGGWLSVVPRFGLRGTYYSETGQLDTRVEERTIEDILPDNTLRIRQQTFTESRIDKGSAAFRGVVNGGLEASFKVSREWNGAESRTWGLDGLRHIVQPYTDLSVVYSSKDPNNILQLDRFQRSTQLPLFDFPQFTSVDAIDDWTIWRWGVRNRFQTRRDNTTFNWLEMDSFLNVNLQEPQFPGARMRQGPLSNLYNRIRWSPVPWVRVGLTSQTPLSSRGFSEINSDLNFLVNEDIRLDIGHRYINDNPFFENSSVINFGAYYRIGDNWSVSFREEYEAVDNLLENQVYQIHRDLSSWVASLGLIIRDSRDGPNEYGVLLTFTLKDLPAISLPLNLDPQGQGVAGKNR